MPFTPRAIYVLLAISVVVTKFWQAHLGAGVIASILDLAVFT